MTNLERKLFDMLTYVGIPALPEPFEASSGRIWVNAIAKVVLRSGQASYALVRNVWDGAPVVCKVLESGSIHHIESIHPFSFLSEGEVPETGNVAALKAFVQRVYGVSAEKVKPLSKAELVKLAYSYAIKIRADRDASVWESQS